MFTPLYREATEVKSNPGEQVLYYPHCTEKKTEVKRLAKSMLELELEHIPRARTIPPHPEGAKREPEPNTSGMGARGSGAVTSEGWSQRPGRKEGISLGPVCGNDSPEGRVPAPAPTLPCLPNPDTTPQVRGPRITEITFLLHTLKWGLKTEIQVSDFLK